MYVKYFVYCRWQFLGYVFLHYNNKGNFLNTHSIDGQANNFHEISAMKLLIIVCKQFSINVIE